MKLLFFILSMFALASFSQEKLVKVNADKFIGVDNLENSYYIKNNVLYKKSTSTIISYTNLHLGKIDLVDITNPLKIILFYKEFNSVIILDATLNELANSINFNEILFKNISFVGTSENASLWLFSQEDNRLLLFNTTNKKVILSKQINANFNFQKAFSNYHYIWLVSETTVLKYNTYGSFISEKNIAQLSQSERQMFYVTKTNNLKLLSITKNLPFKDFFITNDVLYFFNGNTIYSQEFIKK